MQTRSNGPLKVEGPVRLAVGEGLQVLLAAVAVERGEVLPVHVQAAIAMYALYRHAVDAGERGTQGLVALHQGL